jgi:hypothetical protein
VELYKTRGTKIYFKKLIKSLVNIDIEIDDDTNSRLNQKKSTKNQRAFTVIIDKKISEDGEEESRIYNIIENIFKKEKPINTKLYISYTHKIETFDKIEENILDFKIDIKDIQDEIKKENKDDDCDYDY